MKMTLIEDIKQQFKEGNLLTRLILVNLFVFVIVKTIQALFFLLNISDSDTSIIGALAIPANISDLIFKPWSLLSYMFLHNGLWHFAMNMLVLYFSGRIFRLFLTSKQLLGTYIMAGFWGGLLFILFYNIFPRFTDILPYSICLGASASILGILIAAATIAPNYTVHLIILGPVQLKFIAGFYLIMDLVGIASANSGGHIAHIGGAIFGYYFINQLRKGRDVTITVNKIIDSLVFYSKRQPKMKVTHKKTKTDTEYNTQKVNNQAQIDAILDKISKSGYDSLSKTEKDILFRASNQK